MSRYVLFKKGTDVTARELAAITETPGVTVIDQDVRRLFLIEATPETVNKIERVLPGLDDWNRNHPPAPGYASGKRRGPNRPRPA